MQAVCWDPPSKLLSSTHPTATEGYDTDAVLPALAMHTP